MTLGKPIYNYIHTEGQGLYGFRPWKVRTDCQHDMGIRFFNTVRQEVHRISEANMFRRPRIWPNERNISI